MDVNGDLTHAVWKKRAQRDDIILRRGRKRVMVSNYAIGTWQITRETLRAAHQLYLKDKRDYTQLPARLRPPRDLNLNSVDDAVLTTYPACCFAAFSIALTATLTKPPAPTTVASKSPNPAYAPVLRPLPNTLAAFSNTLPFSRILQPTRRNPPSLSLMRQLRQHH